VKNYCHADFGVGPKLHLEASDGEAMPIIPRRQFLIGSALPALLGSTSVQAAESIEALAQNQTVQFRSDGLALSPADYTRLLARLSEDPGIATDDYSRHGVVALLEQEMAALLGKEMAVYLPTGTLANHLAVRLLARGGRRVLVQQESHLYNDAGDCAQQLSGLTLVPLAPGNATFTLAELEAEMRRVETGRVRTAVGAISIELPVRRALGDVFGFAELQNITAFARERRIGLHLDGARLFLASIPASRPRPMRPCSIPSMSPSTSTSTRLRARSLPGRGNCWERSIMSAVCSAAACTRSGPMLLWRGTICTASLDATRGPSRPPMRCFRRSPSTPAAS